MSDVKPIALVVDDNAINRSLVMHILKRIGWETLSASDGQQALDMLAEHEVHMMLLDLRMPLMSGEETCRRVRQEMNKKDLWIVAYTAHGLPEERSKMLENGFNDLLIKPVSVDDMSQICKRALVHIQSVNPNSH